VTARQCAACTRAISAFSHASRTARGKWLAHAAALSAGGILPKRWQKTARR